MRVGPPAGWANWYAASSGVSTMTIMAAAPFWKPHQDMDQLSITWLWISLMSLNGFGVGVGLGAGAASAIRGVSEGRMGLKALGQSRGSSVPRTTGRTV